jgi:hypothetical protein
MPINAGGRTNGAANSQKVTFTGTLATTCAWANGIMSPTTA